MFRFLLPVVLSAAAIGLAVAPSMLLSQPASHDFPGHTFAEDAYLEGWDDPRLLRLPEESDLAFATRATDVVFSSTYHCEVTDYEQSVTTFIVTRLDLLTKDEMVHGWLHPSLMRCGYCHQHAFILAGVLERGGVPYARALGLNGHVVTAFEADYVKYVADADFGVAPFELSTPGVLDRVRANYEGRTFSDEAFNTLMSAYGTEADDQDYVGMAELYALSEKQIAAVKRVEGWLQLAAIGCGILALISALLGWAMRALRKRKRKAAGA